MAHGTKDLHECIVNDAVTSVNVIYFNDFGGFTSTSLEGEKMAHQMKSTMSDQEVFNEIKVKVLRLDFCEASNDPDLVASADVDVTNNTSRMSINGLGLRHNDTTGTWSIVVPKTLSNIDRLIRIAVTNAVVDRYVHSKYLERNRTHQ